MIRVVTNRCHGGFGLSAEAQMHLINTESDLVTKIPVEEYLFTSREDALGDIKQRIKQHIAGGFVATLYGEIVHMAEGVLYQIGGDGQMALRTHPDLISVVETMGSNANGIYSRLVIVDIPDEDVTLDQLEIGEYDGAEWVREKHRTWG